MENILKLGAVVKIDNSPVELMIIGYYPEVSETGAVYTYMGINAEYGISFKDDALYFNQDRITEIVYEGYSDEESDEFRAKLRDYMRTPRV